MAAKFIAVLALAAVAQSSVVPLVKVDGDSSSFSYDVADPNTGDYKSQVETRVGGTVSGQYSLVDPDGTKRIVDYSADDVNGFNAIVRKEPLVASTSVVASEPAVVAARTVNAVVAAAPSFVASAPAVVAARTVTPVVAATRTVVATSPLVATRTVTPVVSAPSITYSPTVYASSSYTPTVYASSSYTPTVYASSSHTPNVYTSSSHNPTFYASSYNPTVYSSSSPVYAHSYVSPSVYSAVPSVYSAYASPYYSSYGWSKPLSYSAFPSAPVNYWVK